MKCTKLPKILNYQKYVWSLKNQHVTPTVKWRIAEKVHGRVSQNYFKLCLTEKFFIIKSLDHCNLLNKRSEPVSKRRHQNKLLLCNVKRNDSMN